MEIIQSHRVYLWTSETYENDTQRGIIAVMGPSWGCKSRMQSSRVISPDEVKNKSETETN